MPFLLVVAGAILLVAGGSWFTGAAAVGTVLVVAGAIWFVLALVVFAGAKRKMNRMHDSFFNRHRRF